MGVEAYGKEYMRERFEQSAVRLLKNIFRVGLFENPYLDVAETKSIVGNPEFMKAGYEAQLKSVVMLKNKENALPIKENQKIYIPRRYFPEVMGYFGPTSPAGWKDAINMQMAAKSFDITDDPAKADVALVFISSPVNVRPAGFSREDIKAGGNGFIPISL